MFANQLVDVEAAAALLGRSADSVRALAARGKLPVAARIRRDRGKPTLRFRLADLEALAEGHDTPT